MADIRTGFPQESIARALDTANLLAYLPHIGGEPRDALLDEIYERLGIAEIVERRGDPDVLAFEAPR